MGKHDTEFRNISERIQKGNTFLITTHEAPDGDAIGSSLGLYWSLEEIGKKPYLFCKDEIPAQLLFLEGARNFRNQLPKEPVDAVFGLDYGSMKRLGIDEYRNAFPQVPFITIDHHLRHDAKGELEVIDEEASSTSELVYQFLLFCGMPISRSVASNLLTGIFTDSGGFRHVSTTPMTLQAVSSLLLKGCSTSYIARKTFHYSPDLLPVFGKILCRLAIDEPSGMASSWLSYRDIAELKLDTEKLDGVATILGTADKARFSLFLTEKKPNFIEASLRNEPFKKFEVHGIAEHFGG
jgi:phosphoesterase RecJ-like protein